MDAEMDERYFYEMEAATALAGEPSNRLEGGLASRRVASLSQLLLPLHLQTDDPRRGATRTKMMLHF